MNGLFDTPAEGEFDVSDSVTEPGASERNRAAEAYFHPTHHAPLAVRMRPRSLDDLVGQRRVLSPGSPLRRLIEGHGDTSVILYGPPGTGKTTLASLISQAGGRYFESLSALSSGVKDIRAAIDRAKRRLRDGQHTVLFIDEVHRFSKTQQDALLAAVENRTVLLVAATTENPSFAVVAPLLSRSLLVTLEPLADEDIATLVRRAMEDPRGFGGTIAIDADAVDYVVALASGDARRALTYLEAAAEAVQKASGVAEPVPESASDEKQRPRLTREAIAAAINQAVVRYDRDGDQHYDVTSAFIKSIRGSDPDAALHYLARMIAAGEDPRFIARRLVIHASEDIGMANSESLLVATAAYQAVSFIGLPEARLTLAHATIHLATAPKSPSVIEAIGAALEDVNAGKGGPVPPHLRDGHYQGAKRLGHAVGYQYPHDDPFGVVAQQYLPDDLADAEYYRPRNHGAEKEIAQRLQRLRGIVRSFLRRG